MADLAAKSKKSSRLGISGLKSRFRSHSREKNKIPEPAAAPVGNATVATPQQDGAGSLTAKPASPSHSSSSLPLMEDARNRTEGPIFTLKSEVDLYAHPVSAAHLLATNIKDVPAIMGDNDTVPDPLLSTKQGAPAFKRVQELGKRHTKN
jgi:hypothetical protein